MRSSNLLKQTLGRISPSLYHIHTRGFSSRFTSDPLKLVDYSPLQGDSLSQEGISKISKMLGGRKSPLLHLKEPKVLQVTTEDIELSDKDKFGSIILVSNANTDFRVRYGGYGIAPSASTTPNDLLKEELVVLGKSFGILSIKKHVPFLIESPNPEQMFALNVAELSEVCEHEENIGRYSIDTICELKPEQAKQMSLALQTRIFHDKKNEYFYEEVTSKVYKPTEYLRSSGTLMSFANNDPTQDKTTAAHYHPGERSLIIVTTNKPAGVTLNLCGVAEDPEQRKDCEQRLEFPSNSLVVLNFPPYTHHKFHGEFDCMSVHPREGVNLIEAVQSDTLPRGFLESATVFSRTDKDSENWKLSGANNSALSKDQSNAR